MFVKQAYFSSFEEKKNAVLYVKHYQAEQQNPPTRGYKTHFLTQSNFHTKDGTISWATSPRLSF